ncbi:hypothetical protein [Haloprofundus halobius]|uniref:hypothetical protein n=1 Tax=Haloprofundus halobius TaxID=2876194 RepID=UPI001CCD25EC|nr:hypothetical protein [Haloprofundus halobius]
MAYANPRNLISTVLLVTGALVFGEALHQSIVSGEASLLSRPILLALALGTVLIALGYWVRVPLEELQAGESRTDAPVDGVSRPDGPVTPADDEYDPRMSPLGNVPSDADDSAGVAGADDEKTRTDQERADGERVDEGRSADDRPHD